MDNEQPSKTLNAAENKDGLDGHILWYGILPIRNCHDTARDSVTSLMNQTRPPGRLVAIDDGSSDGTGEILDELAEKHPDVIRVHHTGSKIRDYSRLPRLWNLGVKLGGPGKYHFYGNGDCTYEPDYMEQLLDVMESDSNVVNTGGVISGKKIPRVPHGAGTLVREQWMFHMLGKPEYPVNLVYEAIPYYYALMNNKKVTVVKTAIMYHHNPLGTYHRFGEWGGGYEGFGISSIIRSR